MAAFLYDVAVNLVVEQKAAAYAFVPTTRGNQVVGGEIFVLAYNEVHEDDPEEPPYLIHYTGGLFNSSSGEEETYCPEDVPADALSLSYTPTTSFGLNCLE